MIKSWKPWEHSTGAKTLEGKERSKMNAYRHGLRGATMRELLKGLRKQGRVLAEVREEIT